MKVCKRFGILMCICAVGCTPDSKKLDSESAEPFANLPVLQHITMDGVLIDASKQLESITYPLLVSNNDSINLSLLKPFERVFLFLDTIKYSKRSVVELIIDPNQPFATSFLEKMPLDFYLIYMDKNGKEIPQVPYQPTYEKVIKLPVFIINRTDSSQVVEHHDGKLRVVQEARDPSGNWVAVEYFELSGCGNSFGLNLIPPHQYLMFAVNKYHGNFSTTFRVHLSTNGIAIFSNEYAGSINKEQFEEI